MKTDTELRGMRAGLPKGEASASEGRKYVLMSHREE